jgi:hypothetical protein
VHHVGYYSYNSRFLVNLTLKNVNFLFHASYLMPWSLCAQCHQVWDVDFDMVIQSINNKTHKSGQYKIWIAVFASLPSCDTYIHTYIHTCMQNETKEKHKWSIITTPDATLFHITRHVTVPATDHLFYCLISCLCFWFLRNKVLTQEEKLYWLPCFWTYCTSSLLSNYGSYTQCKCTL